MKHSESERNLKTSRLRVNPPIQVRSPPYIDQRGPVPCEPYQHLNRDDSGNGWRVGEGSLSLAGQGREPVGPMDQEGRLGGCLGQQPVGHFREIHSLGPPATKVSVKNICREDMLAHTGKGTGGGSETPDVCPASGYVYGPARPSGWCVTRRLLDNIKDNGTHMH